MQNETIFRFSVCPHDTAKNQVAWFTFNTYLQRKLGVRMRFEPQDNIIDERAAVLASPHHLVYANPFSACCFAEQGYIPVARPTGLSDETILAAKNDFDLGATARPLKIASASAKLIIHPLGLTLLPSLGLSEGDVEFDWCGNHMNAIKAVTNGTAQMGFVFNETWNGLSSGTRNALRIVAETKDGKAFHCFMVGPEWKDKADAVKETLCSMASDSSGKSILDELGFQSLEPVEPKVFEELKALVTN